MSSPRPPSIASPRASPKTAPAPLPGAKAAAGGAAGKGAKADKKAAKAAKRAENKLAQGAAPGAQPGSGAPQPGLNGSAGPSRSASGSQPGPGGGKPAQQQPAQGGQQKQTTSSAAKAGQAGVSNVLNPLQPFIHLERPTSSTSLAHTHQTTANIHPAIIKLALQYADFKIVGSNARCIAMLNAFKDVIQSYNPPQDASLSRHFVTHNLKHQIDHLKRGRPLSISMGNFIRYFKSEISQIPIEADVDESKALLTRKIDAFIRDRILLAGKAIEDYTLPKIKDGETILTYGRSSVVEGVLLEAKRAGKQFSVVVVDSRPLYEGKNLLAALNAANIATTYVLLPALSLVLPRVTLCILGTNALLSNGSMFARAGTAMVAMMLREKGVPVVCCCETYKFGDRIMLDSIVGNEMASPAELLAPLLASTEEDGAAPSKAATPISPLNLLYDVSRPKDVTVVISEAGLIPVESVPVLARDYKPLMA